MRHLVGARLLVGVTVRAPDGTLLHQEQFCGQVLDVADGVVVVERPHSPEEPALLPADPEAYDRAAAGRYVLGTTGETVVDPDYVSTWDVVSEADTDTDIDDGAAGGQDSASSHRSSRRAP